MSRVRLYTFTFVVSLAQLSVGMFLGWTSPMIPKLLDEDSFGITMNEASWAVSLLKLGMAFGCFFSVFLIELVGRKGAILCSIVPVLSSWWLTAWYVSTERLYVARFVGGTAGGIIFTAGSIYVTEIAPPQVRGALCSFFVLMDYCGNLLGYVLGTFTNMRDYAFIAMSLSLFQFGVFLFFPETPYHLLRKKDYGAAMDSLISFRGSYDIAEELDSIMRSVEGEPRNAKGFSSVVHLASQPGGKTALLIGVCVMTMQATSGSMVLIAYAQTIFERIDNAFWHESYLSISLAVVHLLSYLFCISQVDRVGRRPLMIVSTIGSIVCSFLLGVYFCMQESGFKIENLQWLPFLTILFYVISVSLGLASIPVVVMNEIFPMYAKVNSVSLCFCLNFAWSFVMVRVWSTVAFGHSMYAAFWLLSSFNAFGIFFLIFYLPETKSETFQRIQEKLVSRKK